MLANNNFIRYVLVGVISVFFGYSTGIISYLLFGDEYGVFFSGSISSFISVLFAFTLQKFLVFKTRGNYLRELFRAFLVYGLSSFAGLLILYFMVEFMRISIWISQAVTVIFMPLISYLAHKNFTFRTA